MPSLEEVELRIETFHMSTYDLGILIEYDDACLDWREEDENVSYRCCTTIRKLTLKLQVAAINLALIKRAFPTVPILALKIFHGRVVEVDLSSFTGICKLWPLASPVGAACQRERQFAGAQLRR